MVRPKASELTEAGRRGRNSKARGHAAERALAKLLTEQYGLPVKRVARSGALKAQADQMAGKAEQYRGDLLLEWNGKPLRIEVKTRAVLPAYIRDKNIYLIDGLCWFFGIDNFINLYKFGVSYGLASVNKENCTSVDHCKVLQAWFKQDNADIVAVRQTGHREWRFAVKLNVVKKIEKWRKEK